ncbi:hypothetical protein [Candidatus Palauibacter sp.]|uniref:hypothetical protein n=1 Tax=Candidatus Palauibacter sp. TaxID=3101350 RepID=UPI003AF2202A
MFELEREVGRWRREVERTSALSPRELDELEDHLRARVDLELHLTQALSPARAFQIAREALGQPAALSREFVKAGRPAWRFLFLAGWALYAASFFLSPAFPPIFEFGYELFWTSLADGAFVLALPNLAMIMTVSVFRSARPVRRHSRRYLRIAHRIVLGLSGLATLGFGVKTLLTPPWVVVDGVGSVAHLGPAYWAWSASLALVATALWLRDRAWTAAKLDVPAL